MAACVDKSPLAVEGDRGWPVAVQLEKSLLKQIGFGGLAIRIDEAKLA